MRKTIRHIALALFFIAALIFPWLVVFNFVSDQLHLKNSGVPVVATFVAAEDGDEVAYRCHSRRAGRSRPRLPQCYYYVEYSYRDTVYTRELLGQKKGTWPLFGGFVQTPQPGETVDAIVDPEFSLDIWSATSIDQWWKGILLPAAVAGVWTLLVGMAIAFMIAKRKD